jgi:hypothetical protein
MISKCFTKRDGARPIGVLIGTREMGSKKGVDCDHASRVPRPPNRISAKVDYRYSHISSDAQTHLAERSDIIIRPGVLVAELIGREPKHL